MAPFSMTGLVKAMVMDGLGYIVILTSKPAHLRFDRCLPEYSYEYT